MVHPLRLRRGPHPGMSERFWQEVVKCAECKGTGVYNDYTDYGDQPCPKCHANGYTPVGQPRTDASVWALLDAITPPGAEFAVGDRVWWTAHKNFGTVPYRCSGTIESVNCGVPYYTDPPEYTSDGHHKSAGRHPAALIKLDGEVDPIAGPLVIAFKDLSHVK